MAPRTESMSCVEVFKWPKGLAAQRPKVLLNSSRSSGSSGSSGGSSDGSSSIVLRTSGVTTRRLSPCTHAYIGMLRREVAGLADLHVITDLSLTAPDELPTNRLRALADEHEAQLEWAPCGRQLAQRLRPNRPPARPARQMEPRPTGRYSPTGQAHRPRFPHRRALPGVEAFAFTVADLSALTYPTLACHPVHPSSL